MAELTEENVRKVLAKLEPYLRADGGGVELTEITSKGIVKVRLTGACAHCPLSVTTLRAGIERALMSEIPRIRRVEQV